jgi:fibro-slime domain-containing protein
MFPIDDQLFGNEGRLHNYDFTLELSTTFHYGGGETLSFTSDDDLWVFVNRKLAIDLGGTHSARSASVTLDTESARLGIVQGNTYPMHLFYAERHVVGAVLHIVVPSADFGVCK